MTICNQLEVFLVQYEFKRIDNIYLIYRGKCGLISKISTKMAKKVAKSLWRLWAEIEAHKWRDLELNLSKTVEELSQDSQLI